MTMQTLTSFVKVRGTAADRTAFRLSDIPQNQEIEFFETDTGDVYAGSRDGWDRKIAGGALLVNAAFIPSSYTGNLTMDGTAQVEALATGVRKVQIANLGVTTEAIRVAFGTDATDAGDNLTIVSTAATTGYYIPAAAEGGSQSVVVLGVPALATHIAVCRAVTADTQSVAVTQGV